MTLSDVLMYKSEDMEQVKTRYRIYVWHSRLNKVERVLNQLRAVPLIGRNVPDLRKMLTFTPYVNEYEMSKNLPSVQLFASWLGGEVEVEKS